MTRMRKQTGLDHDLKNIATNKPQEYMDWKPYPEPTTFLPNDLCDPHKKTSRLCQKFLPNMRILIHDQTIQHAGFDCNAISRELRLIQWMSTRRPDSFTIWVERDVRILVAPLFKNRIQHTVIQCYEKVSMPVRTVVESHMINAPLYSLDLPCLEI